MIGYDFFRDGKRASFSDNRPKPTTCIDRIYRDLETGTVYVAPVMVLDTRYGGHFIGATYSPSKKRRNIQYVCKVSEL